MKPEDYFDYMKLEWAFISMIQNLMGDTLCTNEEAAIKVAEALGKYFGFTVIPTKVESK